jgi:hypothetical protein
MAAKARREKMASVLAVGDSGSGFFAAPEMTIASIAEIFKKIEPICRCIAQIIRRFAQNQISSDFLGF